ncbi:MAG: hypothetical protein NG737_06890 [Omnitrophica bacterium]|nr:hypothetical protein [Candidatus Omnitrophota bacterium]
MSSNKITKLFYFLLLLTAIGFNLYLRLFPAYFPQLKKQAIINVENNIAKKVEKALDKKNISYVPLLRKKVVKEIIKKEKRDRQKFKNKVVKEYKRLKQRYQNQNNRTYLLEVDPYCWMRFTRLILENGYPGNKRVENKIYDTFMLAPQGKEAPPQRFFYYFSSFLYRVAFFIFPSLGLETFLFYLPVFFLFVFFIVLYLFCRYFFSELAGILAIFFVGLSRVVIARSSAGWFDTDVLNILFPLLIFWCLACAVKSKKTILNSLLSFAGGLFLVLFAYSWNGWRFSFVVIGGFFAYFLLNNVALYYKDINKLKKEISPYFISLAVFSITSITFCLIFFGLEPFSSTYNWVWAYLGLAEPLGRSIWPNTYYTVGEFQKAGLVNIPYNMLGWTPLVLAMASSLWIYIRQKRGLKAEIVILLVFWTFGAFFISLKGQRFTFFLSFSLGILLAVGLDELLKLIYLKAKDLKNIKLKIGVLIGMAIGLYLIFFPVIGRSFVWAARQFPMMNDERYDFFVKIKENTPKNCIINSWWDYGNWIKEISRRRVIFDPQTQRRPLAYWMAKVLTTGDELKALRILRMLNNSSDTLFREMKKYIDDDFKTIALLNKILVSDFKDVDRILQSYQLPPEIKEMIKDVIFVKEPPQTYLVVDNSLASKMAAISFLGNWDFRKVFIRKHKNMPKQVIFSNLQEIFSLSFSEAEKLYNEVEFSAATRKEAKVVSKEWVFYLSLKEGKQEKNIVYFDNGVVLNLKDLKARIFSPKNREYNKFRYVLLFDGENLVYKRYDDARIKSGILAIKENDEYKCIGLSADDLGRSLYARLYLGKAKGLKYFEPFILDDKSGFYAFKIKWPKADNQNH